MDLFDRLTRSRIMKCVKSEDTSPEIIVRSAAHRLGFRFRLHRADLPGKPDLVFPRTKKVVFVHGCFWHGHRCVRGNRTPKTNVEYWKNKIQRNCSRDARNVKALRQDGWQVMVIWECELRNDDAWISRLSAFLSHTN